MKHYIHDIPGRLRIRTPFIKGNEEAFKETERILFNVDGIKDISVNSLTGSITIIYDHQIIRSKQLIELFEKSGYFNESEAISNSRYIRNLTSKAGFAISRAIFGCAVEKILQPTGLSFLAVLI